MIQSGKKVHGVVGIVFDALRARMGVRGSYGFTWRTISFRVHYNNSLIALGANFMSS
jgi:hypothetical protein